MTSQASIWELPDSDRPVEGLDAYGAPDPAYAAALGLVSAPLGRRAGAAAIDIGLFWLLQLPFLILSLPLFRRLLSGRITWYGFVNHPDFVLSVVVAAVTLLLTILLLVAQLVVQGRWGFTLGKLVVGLRAVNVSTLERPGFWLVTLRALVVWLPVLTVLGPILFLASPLWSREDRCRGWHDRVGRVWLVDARRGLDPFDKKRMRIARKTVTSAGAPRVKRLPSLATDAAFNGSNGYRPGARTSAGVLGVARPHAGDRRVVVGLSGFEAGEPAPMPSTTTDRPRLGAPLTAPSSDASTQLVSHPHAGTGVTLLLDGGQRIPVSTPVVVGRSPVAIDGALPLAIADPDFSISKVHVVLRPVSAGLEVIDQGSTNGTSLVHDGREQPLAAGEVATARFGDTIRIGERTAQVLSS